MLNFIKEVETKYDVSSIVVNNIQIWPFLRAAYYFGYGQCYKFDKTNQNKNILGRRLKGVKNAFYGLENLFRKYDYLIFSNILERKLIDGRYVDRIAEFLISELGKENTLLIEDPASSFHFKRSQVSICHITSLDLLRFLYYMPLPRKFIINIKNEAILKEINKRYDLNVIYREWILKFYYYKNLLKLFYKIYKPKVIFINCYYSWLHQLVIYSAKKSGIRTIELQHGVINDKHPAYNVFAALDKSFFPDYLFTFGDYVEDIFDEGNYFIERKNVFSVGSMYIDYINNEYKPSLETVHIFNDFRKKYKKIVVVSDQYAVKNKLMDFLEKTALLDKEILYIFVPRNANRHCSNINSPKNITILKKLDVYQIIKNADFHSTVFSTCSLEAPALGIPNILININNFSKDYYSSILKNKDITRFANTPEEFVDILSNWHPKTKEEIKKMHRNFYKQNHKENLKQVLKKTLV